MRLETPHRNLHLTLDYPASCRAQRNGYNMHQPKPCMSPSRPERGRKPCHPELPFTSHKRGIDETWDPAWRAGNSEFQTAAKDLAAPRARSFAALRMTVLGHLG